MESGLEQRLRTSSKEQLISLLRELTLRHPILPEEIVAFLDDVQSLDSLSEAASLSSDGDEDTLEDDWDFGGDEPVMMHTFHRPVQLPAEEEIGKRNIEDFVLLLSQQETPQVLADTLTDLLDEAELRTEQDDYPAALDLYALLIDERLLERTPAVVPILDEAIDAAAPALEDLLVEASSNAMFDAAAVSLSPLLTSTVRHQWLDRLFRLWLKRLDLHRIEEDLPDIILNVAWSEDIPLLRSFTQNELQKHPRNEHSNIVNFTQQYRSRALEKFLKELPKT